MYVVGSIIGPIIFKNTPPKILVSLSCFISMVAMNLTGPATFLPLPHDFGLLLGGMLFATVTILSALRASGEAEGTDTASEVPQATSEMEMTHQPTSNNVNSRVAGNVSSSTPKNILETPSGRMVIGTRRRFILHANTALRSKLFKQLLERILMQS